MLAKLLLFEWKYQFKQTSFRLFSIGFFLLGVYFCAQEGAINLDNPFHIHLFVGLISLCSVFLLMFQCSTTMLRDITHNAEQMIYSTSVHKGYFLASRFLGILSTAIFASLLYVMGMYFGAILNISDAHSGESFEFIHFVWPWILIVVPNILFISCALFGIATFSKSTVLTFLGALLLFVAFWINNMFIGSPFTGGKIAASPELMQLIALTDPFGLCASHEQIQFWTPFEKDLYMVGASGHLLNNRLLWISASMLISGIIYAFYTYKLSHSGKKNSLISRLIPKSHPRKTIAKKITRPYFTVDVSSESAYAQFRALIDLVKVDFKNTLADKKFVALLIIWVVMIFMAIQHHVNGQDVYGSSYPTTALISHLILEPLSYLGLFLVIFYAGELVWRPKLTGFHEILNASPIPNALLLLSKYLVLAMIPAFLILTGISLGILFQIMKGYYVFQFSLYAQLFYYGFLPLLLYVVLAVFAQSLVANKYIGMLLSAMIILGLKFIPASIGWEHPLFNFFQLPNLPHMYSDFVGFGQISKTFHAFALLWAPLVGIFLLFNFKIFNRSTERNIRSQLASLQQRWTSSQMIALAALLILVFGTGVRIYYLLHVASPYTNTKSRIDAQEAYEKNYKVYQNLPTPELIGIQTQVDLYPGEKAYEVAGTYTFKNTGDRPMDTLLISTPKPMEQLNVENAKLIQQDSWSFEAWLFKLDVSLSPGMTCKLTFKFKEEITGLETNQDILKNGTYLRSSSFEPRMGYAEALEIKQEQERKRRALPEKIVPARNEQSAGFDTKNGEKIHFETIISTDQDQIALGPGSLVDLWKKEQRAYFHYKSQGRTDKTISYFSSAYHVQTEQYKGVQLAIYYHPNHGQNIAEIFRAAKATLDYGNEHFAPYPLDHLRIAEVPLHWKFGGHALAGTIALHEKLFTQNSQNPSEEINQLSRVVVHEIAHQWWGHLLSPKSAKGANFLTESLANYTESQVLERLYGKVMTRKLSEYGIRRYFKFRSEAEEVEPPLYLVENEIFISYRKGHVIMRALKDLLGEDSLNQALQNLIQKHQTDRSATSLDFLAELHAIAPKPKHRLIDDWMKKRIRYDLSLDSVSYRQLNNGKYEIKGHLFSRRFEMDDTGEEQEIGIEEEIQIGLFPQHPGDMERFDSAAKIQKVEICEPKTKLSFIVDTLPAYIAVDPFFLRLDQDKLNQVKAIK